MSSTTKSLCAVVFAAAATAGCADDTENSGLSAETEATSGGDSTGVVASSTGNDGSSGSSGGTTTDGPDESEGTSSGSGSTGPDSSTGDGSEAGSESGSTGSGTGLEIAGEWSSLGGLQNITITEEAWDVSGSLGAYTLDIVEYDNVQRYVLAVDEGEMWWRQQWTYDGDQLYFCTVTFDSLSMEEALALEPADSSDLVTGCGGYAWPDLSPSA